MLLLCHCNPLHHSQSPWLPRILGVLVAACWQSPWTGGLLRHGWPLPNMCPKKAEEHRGVFCWARNVQTYSFPWAHKSGYWAFLTLKGRHSTFSPRGPCLPSLLTRKAWERVKEVLTSLLGPKSMGAEPGSPWV